MVNGNIKILDFLVKEEILWERNNNSIPIIKQFCLLFLIDKIFKKKRNSEEYELKHGIKNFSIDFLESINFNLNI